MVSELTGDEDTGHMEYRLCPRASKREPESPTCFSEPLTVGANRHAHGNYRLFLRHSLAALNVYFLFFVISRLYYYDGYCYYDYFYFCCCVGGTVIRVILIIIIVRTITFHTLLSILFCYNC